MSKRSALAAVQFMAAMASMGSNPPSQWHKPWPETPWEKEGRLKREARQNELRPRYQGLKQFFYGENNLWALNQKNADRKAKKNNWI